MTFEHPLVLAVGLLVLIVGLPLFRGLKDVFVAEAPLGPPEGTPFKAPYNLAGLMKVVGAMETVGVAVALVAAAGPISLSTQTVWLSRGADIIFVLDISPSMAGLDMNSRSRFEAARELVREFAAKRPSDAIGLVGVGKEASLLVPPTIDREALYVRLDSVRLGELGDGTALGLGMAIAGLHVGNSKAPRKAVVLITDGENNAGSVNPATGAEIVREVGANLWVIAVGSGGQIHIDYTDPFTKIRRTGLFESRFDSENLAALADKGGGVFIAATSPEAFNEAFDALDRGEMTIQRSGAVTKTKALHMPFIVAALALLAAARFIRRRIVGAFL